MRIVLPVLAVASAFVVPQRRLGARSTRRESPASSGTGPCSALGARIDRMRRHSSAFEGETERGDLEPVPKAAAKEARTLLNATWHYAWARRGEVTTRARRVARDCRDVAAEVTDYAAASAYLSRAHVAAWAQAGTCLAMVLVVAASLASSSAVARPLGVGSFGAARALAARGVAGLYGVGFLMALRQNRALVGSRGLSSATATLDRVATRQSTWRRRVEAAPTLLWFCYQGKELDAPKKRVSLDAGLDVVAASGLACAAPLFLFGAGGGPGWLALAGCYACYLSLATVGAPFYSYGWESQLLETTALCLLPQSPQWLGVLAFRWLCFKIMLGAGLIKLRARGRATDGWFDLSAMSTFFETQPLPGPLSRRLHFLPKAAHRFATASNHVIELFAPALLPLGLALSCVGGAVGGLGRAATAGYGLVHILFQGALVASGNLSFLNYLTMVPALMCFDDAFLGSVGPAAAAPFLQRTLIDNPLAVALGALLLWLNRPTYENLAAPARRGDLDGRRPARQAMNSTFDRVVDVRPAYRALGLSDDAPRPVNLRAFRLANAFGAFGSVNDRKNALVVEGKRDGEDWREYDFRALPADPTAKLRQVSPWHWRLDWQLWISACRGRDATTERWFLTLLHKLATNDEATSSLLNENPFAAGDPPSQVRVSQYTYKFAPLDDPDGRVWTREQSGVLLKPTDAASLKVALDK